MNKNKNLDIFKEFSLKEVLHCFRDEEFLVHFLEKNAKDYMGFCEIIIDEDHENDIGFFSGDRCVGSLSSKDMLKLIDHDTLRVVKSEQSWNIGATLKFHLVKKYSFI